MVSVDRLVEAYAGGDTYSRRLCKRLRASRLGYSSVGVPGDILTTLAVLDESGNATGAGFDIVGHGGG